MKTVLKNWKSFYASLKDWKANPSKYTGKPNIPRYSRATMKEIEFTNQDCVIKEPIIMESYVKERDRKKDYFLLNVWFISMRFDIVS